MKGWHSGIACAALVYNHKESIWLQTETQTLRGASHDMGRKKCEWHKCWLNVEKVISEELHWIIYDLLISDKVTPFVTENSYHQR